MNGGVEVNCCANPVTLIRLYKIAHPEFIANEALVKLLGQIESDSMLGIQYISELENPKNVRWHEIKQRWGKA